MNEVVLGFDLCPWAEPALRAGRVARAVCLAAAPSAEACLPFIDAFVARSQPEVEVGLLLFPRFNVGWAAFDAFTERVRRADAGRRANEQTAGGGGRGGAPPFLAAAFHPDGVETFATAAQAISFVRRTPDPTVQFVRADILDRLKANQPHASTGVTERNYRALGDPGQAARLDAAVSSIRADRDRAYRRLA